MIYNLTVRAAIRLSTVLAVSLLIHHSTIAGETPPTLRGTLVTLAWEKPVSGIYYMNHGKPEELKLPGLLPGPWLLDRKASSEKEPFVSQFGADAESHLWAREASLVYWSPRRPTASPLQQINQAQPVESYYL